MGVGDWTLGEAVLMEREVERDVVREVQVGVEVAET